MKSASRLKTFLFLCICSLWIVPAGLVHELTAHEDSHDACLETGPGDAVGTEHHHCESLQLAVPPLLPGAPSFAFLLPEKIATLHVLPAVRRICACDEAFLFFRGPPVA